MTKLIYVCSPVTHPNPAAQGKMYHKTLDLAETILYAGAFPVSVSHLVREFGYSVDMRQGQTELLKRADAVLLGPDWREAPSCREQFQEALARGIPIFLHWERDAIREWVKTGRFLRNEDIEVVTGGDPLSGDGLVVRRRALQQEAC